MNAQALTVADLTTLLGLIAAVAGLWWRIEQSIKSVKSDVALDISAIEKDLKDANASLAYFKTEVAKEYARNGYIRDVEERVLARVGEVVSEIHGLRAEISEAVKVFMQQNNPPQNKRTR
jgi:uncharacterized membrane protein YfbV (UPF0208 family)